MSSSFIKHFAILSSGTVVNMLISVLTTPVITRLVDPMAYGSYSLFLLFGNIALAIFGLGLDQSLARFFYSSSDLQEKASLLKVCYVLPNMLFLLAVLLVLIIASLTHELTSDHSLVNVLFMAYVIGLLFNRNAAVVLRLEFKSKQYSLANILNKGLFAALSVLMLVVRVALSDGVILCLSLTCACYLVSIYEIIASRSIWCRSLRSPIRIGSIKEILSYGAPYIISSVAALFMSGFGQIALESAGMKSEVGVYAAAVSLAGIFSLIQTSFNTIWLPYITQRYEEDDSPFQTIRRANDLVTLGMISLGLLVVLLKDCLVLFLGPEYRASSQILPFLCFQPVLYTISETTMCGMVFAKKSLFQALVGTLSCLINICLCASLVPAMGLNGAAISAACAYLLFFILRTTFSQVAMRHELHFKKLGIAIVVFVVFSIAGSLCAGPMLACLYLPMQATVILCYRREVIYMIKALKRKVKR